MYSCWNFKLTLKKVFTLSYPVLREMEKKGQRILAQQQLQYAMC
jgi:hypothetical protein